MRRRVFRPGLDLLEARIALSVAESAADVAPVLTSVVSPVQRLDAAAVQRHQEFLARIATQHDDVVFFGDSMVDFWGNIGRTAWSQKLAPLGAANFGVAGDMTRNLLWRLENGELAGQPQVAIVEIGTNDILFDTSAPDVRVANTVAAISAVVATIRAKSPQTKILLMGIFPQGATPKDPTRIMIQQVNAQIARLDDGVNVRFLDVSAKLLHPDGTRLSTPYGIHLSSDQYDIWAGAIYNPIQNWLGRPGAPTVRNVRMNQGRRVPPTLVVTFDHWMGPSSVGDSANFHLLQEMTRGSRGGPARTRVIPIRRVIYDPLAQTATLVLSRRLAPSSSYTLTINGTPPSGVKDIYGSYLDGLGDGDPGNNYTVTF